MRDKGTVCQSGRQDWCLLRQESSQRDYAATIFAANSGSVAQQPNGAHPHQKQRIASGDPCLPVSPLSTLMLFAIEPLFVERLLIRRAVAATKATCRRGEWLRRSR
jgi:hypothetical protein